MFHFFKKHVRSVYLILFGTYMLPTLLANELQNRSRILDVGCGYSSNIRLICKESYKIGIDFYYPYIIRSKKSLFHSDYVLGNSCALPFKSKSFDCAVAIEVIEHLDKDNGSKMLAEMKRVARKIILTTPNGFLPASAGVNDNPDEKHLSGWTVNELKKFGFKIYGFNGIKSIWKLESGVVVRRTKSQIVFLLLLGVTEILAYHCPNIAFQLFCVKDVDDLL